MAGIGSGLVFGLCMAALVSFNSIKQTVAPLFENSEQVIKAGPANHFQRNISMGGWLYLTNARLVFRSHSFLQKTYELSIPTSNITQAQPCMTMWIIPNGLRITINEGNFEQFVVEQQHAWVATIRERNLSLTPNSV